MTKRVPGWPWVGLLLLPLLASEGAGAEVSPTLLMLPKQIDLKGPHATQRLLVEELRAEQFVGDRTGEATFSSSNEAVAIVENGVVVPVGDGSATLTAQVGDTSVSARVTVRDAQAETSWSFRNHVISVLTKVGCNSGACHGALAGKKGFKLTLRGYAPLVDYHALTRQAVGRRIVKTDPARSLMLLKPTMTLVHGGGKRIEPGSREYNVLVEWIAAGTPPPTDDDPRLDHLEVIPSAVTLLPDDKQQFLVRAHFSDGHTEDVTTWVKYTSTAETVAEVNETGHVTVTGHGEAAVTVWYLSKVAVARVRVPYDIQLNASVFATAPRHNFIDDLVLEKLKTLRVPPSSTSDDSEFLRRAYLDAAGILPTAEQTVAFLNDASSDKRERLIDHLLQRPEYVDYWAYKWCDLMLVSSRKLAKPAMWSFYRWIHEAVAANKPWDQFAREVLTARGNTLENGAANYFVLHKDPTDLTETTALTFLGMSITCARCHNHPMEKWTTDDYYGMANLFARVKLKDTGRSGESILLTSPTGNVNHPQLGRPLPPRPLEAEPMPLEAAGDRRRHFADWLTRPDNPFFARAVVNRVWANFLGRGLVESVDDLRATNPASNEKLLEALVEDFISHGFDVKHLIRTLMNSATYQANSEPVEGNAQDTLYLSHYLVKRLPAEVLLDAVSQVTGVPSEFSGYPPGWRALQLPDTAVTSEFLTTFGRPQREFTCDCERQDAPSIAQALHLANGETVNEKLRAQGGVLDELVASPLSNDDVVTRLYLSALSRYPTETERDALIALLDESIPSPSPHEPGKVGVEATENDASQSPRRQVLEDLYWAVLTSEEFLFNH